jgi:hypothetical protein
MTRSRLAAWAVGTLTKDIKNKGYMMCMGSFHSDDDLFKDLTWSGIWISLCKQKSASDIVRCSENRKMSCPEFGPIIIMNCMQSIG